MRFSRLLTAVDSHTEGMPTRVVVGGVPNIPGKTMFEKTEYVKRKMDHLRTALMCEPRGHSAMMGAILTQPANAEADMGVVFIEIPGYLPMCGHAAIGVCTVMVETGIVPATEPETRIILDTPAGLIRARLLVKDGRAQSVTIRNVPSFLYEHGRVIDVPGLGEVTVDIAYGGNFYAILPANSVGLEVRLSHTRQLIETGLRIREAAIEQVTLDHPEIGHFDELTVEFTGEPEHPDAHAKNAVLMPTGNLDRSPCGTGTSAKLACLYKKGDIKLNQEFVHESIIGSIFRARAVEETSVGSYQAVVPEITGRAWITGIHQFVIDPTDPFKDGFIIRT